jgi:hypothetical protein
MSNQKVMQFRDNERLELSSPPADQQAAVSEVLNVQIPSLALRGAVGKRLHRSQPRHLTAHF